MNNYKIAIIAGDGTGPEVIRQGLKVLQAVSEKFGFKYEKVEYDLGAERYLKTGEALPESVFEELKTFNAIYLGAIGDSRVKPGILEKGILLKIRFGLDQYINLRPVILYDKRLCPLKDKEEKDI
ncbi:MAG TPA: 3-isopropylmalate dehydrogenase, partial [Candidatus Omnitrophica bacterium]|nr:3-isopropylmalate dehydrogenase [Candidatus Omnitrophota bacterium]